MKKLGGTASPDIVTCAEAARKVLSSKTRKLKGSLTLTHVCRIKDLAQYLVDHAGADGEAEGLHLCRSLVHLGHIYLVPELDAYCELSSLFRWVNKDNAKLWQLACDLRNAVESKDHSHLLKRHMMCFSGKEAVRWMCRQDLTDVLEATFGYALPFTPATARKLGSQMINAGYFFSVGGLITNTVHVDTMFQGSSNAFYRWLEDWPSGEQTPGPFTLVELHDAAKGSATKIRSTFHAGQSPVKGGSFILSRRVSGSKKKTPVRAGSVTSGVRVGGPTSRNAGGGRRRAFSLTLGKSKSAGSLGWSVGGDKSKSAVLAEESEEEKADEESAGKDGPGPRGASRAAGEASAADEGTHEEGEEGEFSVDGGDSAPRRRNMAKRVKRGRQRRIRSRADSIEEEDPNDLCEDGAEGAQLRRQSKEAPDFRGNRARAQSDPRR